METTCIDDSRNKMTISDLSVSTTERTVTFEFISMASHVSWTTVSYIHMNIRPCRLYSIDISQQKRTHVKQYIRTIPSIIQR
jgi:hypothetical protein